MGLALRGLLSRLKNKGKADRKLGSPSACPQHSPTLERDACGVYDKSSAIHKSVVSKSYRHSFPQTLQSGRSTVGDLMRPTRITPLERGDASATVADSTGACSFRIRANRKSDTVPSPLAGRDRSVVELPISRLCDKWSLAPAAQRSCHSAYNQSSAVKKRLPNGLNVAG